jgi:hypothetical protein
MPVVLRAVLLGVHYSIHGVILHEQLEDKIYIHVLHMSLYMVLLFLLD